MLAGAMVPTGATLETPSLTLWFQVLQEVDQHMMRNTMCNS